MNVFSVHNACLFALQRRQAEAEKLSRELSQEAAEAGDDTSKLERVKLLLGLGLRQWRNSTLGYAWRPWAEQTIESKRLRLLENKAVRHWKLWIYRYP